MRQPSGLIESLAIACITAVVLIVLYLFSLLIPDFTIDIGQKEVERVNWSNVVRVWLILYFLASTRVWQPVQPDQVAVRILLGKPIDFVESGLVFAPLWIFEVRYIDIKLIQKEFPAEPEFVYEGEMKERKDLPEGMRPAIRITFNDSIHPDDVGKTFKDDEVVLNLHRLTSDVLEKELKINVGSWRDLNRDDLEELENELIEKKPGADGKVVVTIKRPDLIVKFNATQGEEGLHKRLTTVVTPVILWKIVDPIKFIIRVGHVNTANQWIEDDMVAILQRILPLMSVAQAMDNIGWINAHLLFSVSKRMADEGIEIQNAYIKKIPIHRSLNEQISARGAAFYTGTAEAQKIRLQGAAAADIVALNGKAEAEVIALTGKAKADAARQLEEETLRGRAAGIKKMMEDLGVSGADVQAAEIARAVADGGNTIVIGTDGFTQIAGIATAMQGKKKPDAAAPKPSDGDKET